MGYDMNLEHTPEDMAEQKAAYDREWNEWLRAYDGGKPAPSIIDPTYFRLNIFGMSKYREYMVQFGMLAYNYPQPTAFYEGLTEEPLAGEEPGIPVDKLGSNDHWLVRPEECASALTAYDKFTKEQVRAVVGDDLEYWNKWIAFIRLAAVNGGFRVD